jgi:ADP-heptose:LPS heptosyltransferase
MGTGRLLNTDCRFFLGSRPCRFNKSEGAQCHSCRHYQPIGERVLIIKLDAIGDVLRTSCITPKIKEQFPGSYLVWLTREDAADLVRANPDVDEVWTYGVESLNLLGVREWDYVFSCSNDAPSAALATMARARISKIGFWLSSDGVIIPSNVPAREWLEMAAFDSVKQANQRSFQHILYDICGFSEPIHFPRLSLSAELMEWAAKRVADWVKAAPQIIGINTGAGRRWPRKMPGVKQLIWIIQEMQLALPQSRFLLLGGPEELEKNQQILAAVDSSRVHDAGCHYTLLEFAALISQCHTLLCGDTLALHLACALKIPSVALFGPTSLAEIFSYSGLVEKLSAESLPCLCCYSNCALEQDCMTGISTQRIVGAMVKQLRYQG